MADSINNSEDIIDSRNIIERIEELEGEREALANDVTDATDAITDHEEATAEAEEAPDLGTLQADLDAATEALKNWDESEEAEELKTLKALESEAEDSGDWKDGATLIHEDYFVEYAQQMAEDIGAVNADATWPNNHIDWNAAADELKADYSEVDFDGQTYLVRD